MPSFFTRWRALVPDIDKGKSLERIEYEADPLCETGKLEAIERLAKRKVSDQVESGPDISFEQVNRFRARNLDSDA